MELKRHVSYWMNWKRWEHLNGRDRDWEDLGDEQYKRLMAYMKALQKLEAMESIVEEQN